MRLTMGGGRSVLLKGRFFGDGGSTVMGGEIGG